MKMSKPYNFQRKINEFYKLRDNFEAYVRESEASQYIKFALLDFPPGIHYLNAVNQKRTEQGLPVVNYVTDERKLRFDRVADAEKQAELNELSRQKRYASEHTVIRYVWNNNEASVRRHDFVPEDDNTNWDFRVSRRAPVVRQV